MESLDSEGVETAIVLQSERPALSLVDSFALALADRQGWHLLTEDRTMRTVAQSKGIAHRDALWVIDNMLDAGILSAPQVVGVLEAMGVHPRCPVPKPGLASRLATCPNFRVHLTRRYDWESIDRAGLMAVDR